MERPMKHTNYVDGDRKHKFIFYFFFNREHPVALNSQGIQIVNIFRIFVFDGKY